jgi:hypothetical protein
MAAVELYRVTSEKIYLQAARGRADNLILRLSPTGYYRANAGGRPFWHASDAGLPDIALLEYFKIESDALLKQKAAKAIARNLLYQLSVTGKAHNPFGYAKGHLLYNNKIKESFFLNHKNETGYWWQGENARIASLSAAAALGCSVLRDYINKVKRKELAEFSENQLNWILGLNPFDVCFMDGTGSLNPPSYGHSKPQHSTLPGGIANGVTGKFDDGSGIRWFDGKGQDRWRWIEQWLPHSTWYMMAIVTDSLSVCRFN